MSRADFLALVAASGAITFPLLAGAMSAEAGESGQGQASDGAQTSTIRIIQATDLHFLSPRLTDHGAFFHRTILSSDSKVMEYSEEMVDTLVEAVIAEHPDVLVLTGDLTYNGGVASHEDLAAKLRLVKDAGIAVVAMPGNHDLDMTQAVKFVGDGCELAENATAEKFRELYWDFGYADALSRDDASLSYVWECAPDLWLLVVDVNGVPLMGTVPATTLAWVEGRLAEAADRGIRVIGLSHQNVLQQTFIGYGYQMDNAAELLALYERYGVVANFSGHLHMQLATRSDSGFLEVATSALSVSPNHYAHITVTADELTYQTAELDVAQWAESQGITDPDLLDFSNYARDFFEVPTYEGALAQAREAGAENAEELAEWLTVVNYAFFCGNLDTVEVRPDLIEQWRGIAVMTGYYLDYIFNLTPVANTNSEVVELG